KAPAAVRNGKISVVGAIALAAMIFVAYLPALNAGYIWDDQDYVVQNSNLVRPDGLRRISFEPQRSVQYYPLVHPARRIECHYGHLFQRGYHGVNVLLHGLNAILLWILLAQLAVPGAWFIAAVFGLHPVQVESVAWITEIKNLLSGAFFFLSILAYLQF